MCTTAVWQGAHPGRRGRGAAGEEDLNCMLCTAT